MTSGGQIETQHIVFAVEGVDLHVVAAGPHDGPLVILLHGFPETGLGWRNQIAPLAEAGFRVVVPDQRGYGQSSKPSGVAAYGLDILAADLLSIANACGTEKFDLVGHDWGGIVAWWAALKYPGRVRRLVVVNAPHPVAGRRYAKRHWGQILRSWYIAFFQIRHVPEWLLSRGNFALLRGALTISGPKGLFTEDDFRRYREAWSEPGALTPMLDWYRAFRHFRARIADLVVRQPTLILWGDRDLYLAFGLAQASLAFCADGRLRRVEGASHWLQHEGPEMVAEEIIGFLSAA